MRPNRPPRHGAGWLLAGLFMATAAAVFAAENPNLAFEPGPDGRPLHWHGKGRATVQPDADHTLKVAIDGPGHIGYIVNLKPEWQRLQVDLRMRATDLVPGKELSWQTGRLGIRFTDDRGEMVGDWPKVFSVTGTTDWLPFSGFYDIPPGATKLEFTPSHFGRSGKVEFSGLALSLPGTRALRDAPSPTGQPITELWNLVDAWRQKNDHRETVCLNGLWNFLPVADGGSASDRPPADGSGWGFFKVPGIWPGKEGWMEAGKAQAIHGGPAIDPLKLNTAWYRRAVAIPEDWTDRRVELEITLLQTSAQVFVDGRRAGELYYPGGFVDLTGRLLPGKSHELALLVSAVPEASAGQAYLAPDRLISREATVKCRGLAGDAYLHARPARGRLEDVHVVTSFRNRTVTFDVGLAGLVPGRHRLEAEIRDGDAVVETFRSEPFDAPADAAGAEARHAFTAAWFPPKLWDTDTPDHLYTAEVRLFAVDKDGGDGGVVDRLFPETFGFREFWTEGRDFMLNGVPIRLRSLVTMGPSTGADMGFAARIATICDRIKPYGFNHLISYNYDFAPGAVGYQDDLYRVTSRRGVLTSLSLPHIKDFNNDLADPVQARRYREQCAFLIRRFQNLPGVVLYAMNHNATGYYGDQNPLKLDGVWTPEAHGGRDHNRREAERAHAIARALDPSRPVYHHQSGNLGDVYTVNCYLNWSPMQERDDWLEDWEKNGRKPLFFVEWGMPHRPSWSSYRGPEFIWASKTAIQWLWINEYNAEHLGEGAYRLDDGKKAFYRRHAELGAGKKPTPFWDFGDFQTPDIDRVRAAYMVGAMRHLRARGLSGILPWDQHVLWRLAADAKHEPPPHKPYENLKRPGIVPDSVAPGEQYMDAFDPRRFVESDTGGSVLPQFREVIAWIAGPEGDFSAKHNTYAPGETVARQLVLVNDARRPVDVAYTYRLSAGQAPSAYPVAEGKGSITVPAGGRAAVPITVDLPAKPDPVGGYELTATFDRPGAPPLSDRLPLAVIVPEPRQPAGTIGLYDPKGLSAPLFERLNLPVQRVVDAAGLDGVSLLVIGREGLAERPFALDGAVRDGLKVLVLEQSYETLSRFGFRANVRGLRELFASDASLGAPPLAHWRGAATLVPPYLEGLDGIETTDPQWVWNGFDNTRVWRAGNRGNVASVLPEKPSRGNFLPLVHGGFDLQYAPLLEWTDGRGMVVFSQLDLSGRTAADPRADDVFRRLLLRLDAAQPQPRAKTFHRGDDRSRELLRRLGIRFVDLADGDPVPADAGLLVAGPGATPPAGLADRIDNGLDIVSLGLSRTEMAAWFPQRFRMTDGVYFSEPFDSLRTVPEFAGLSDAELHWRGELPFAAFDPDGPGKAGGRALALVRAGKGRIVAVQVAPWMFDPDNLSLRTSVRRNAFLVSRILHNLRADSGERLAFDGPDADRPDGAETRLADGWVGKADPDRAGDDARWFAPGHAVDGSWRPVRVPGRIAAQFDELKGYAGNFWYRNAFDVNGALPGDGKALLRVGVVADSSWIWLNGHFVGELSRESHPAGFWQADRSYEIPTSWLKPTGNVLVVRCSHPSGNGGLLGHPLLRLPTPRRFHYDAPRAEDDPYRYYRW